jgi:phospholipid/cholesterol/gamma-HCH transport system substrate-binding protein
VPKLLDPKGSLKTILDDDNKLYDKIQSLIGQVDDSLKNVKSITGSLNSEIPRISTILQEGKTTLEKAQDVLEGLKNNPVLKGGIPERKEQQPSIQGLRDEAF